MSGGGGEREEGAVSYPEREERNVERNGEESSSGEAENWTGRMRGVPRTAHCM
jgi:hypothetical protein